MSDEEIKNMTPDEIRPLAADVVVALEDGQNRLDGLSTDWLTGRGRGRGEQPVVPEPEFTSYYGHGVVKPVPDMAP